MRAIAPSPAGTADLAGPAGDGGGAGGLDGLTADLEAASALLDRCADELADGDFTVAVETLTAVRLPLADAWPPSRAYLAAWTQIAGALGNQADRQASQTADALADVAADLSSRIDGLAAVVDSAAAAWRRRQDETWTALTGAADTVKRDAAAALRGDIDNGRADSAGFSSYAHRDGTAGFVVESTR